MTNLIISDKYHNTLDIEAFSRMLKDPSFCYKFFWLEAIVQLISENKESASYDEIINKMICNAWYPVLEYHIHLSGLYGENLIIKDNLERAVLRLQELSGLPNSASKIDICNALMKYEKDKELHKYKIDVTKNVPYRALASFVQHASNPISLDNSYGRMIAYYNRLNETEISLPYIFTDAAGLKRKLIFQEGWIPMIQDNAVTILSWIQLEKIKWLQNNNPEVPGLVYKITPSEEKSRKLRAVRNLWDAVLEISPIKEVFKNAVVDRENYDIDHFIPWSFVMNDELWNLMPMDSSWNSKKSNKLPIWDTFFERFANNQYILYDMIYSKPGIEKLYHSCQKDNLHSIWANRELYRKGNSQEKFYTVLEENMKPVYDSAKRQGYDIWSV